MRRLRQLLARGLEATAALWPSIETAYAWVHQAAHLLANAEGRPVAELQSAYRDLLADMAARRAEVGGLTPAVDQFLKVTASYWPGLFHCYTVPDLPRTNNDLEQLFGSVRHHERRATGRKRASAILVLRGSVRVVAALATRSRRFRGADLRPADLTQWHQLRQSLAYRHEARCAQRRFRRDPAAYLAALEEQLLQFTLPP